MRAKLVVIAYTYQLSDFKIRMQMTSNTYKGPVLIGKLLWEHHAQRREALEMMPLAPRMIDGGKLRDEGMKLHMHSGPGPPLLPWVRGWGAGRGEELLLLQALSRDSRCSQVSVALHWCC